MCIMGRDDGNTVKTPARPEDGVTVDPIDPNPGRRSSNRRSSPPSAKGKPTSRRTGARPGTK